MALTEQQIWDAAQAQQARINGRNRKLTRATLEARLQATVDKLQADLVEMGCQRYPCAPMLNDARINSALLVPAAIGMQIQALGQLAESFGIYLRFLPEVTA